MDQAIKNLDKVKDYVSTGQEHTVSVSADSVENALGKCYRYDHDGIGITSVHFVIFAELFIDFISISKLRLIISFCHHFWDCTFSIQ